MGYTINEMLESVARYLEKFGEINYKIIEAMMRIDRKNFVPRNFYDFAYNDSTLPLGHGKTISQPSTVARMLSLLELSQGQSVLEIGTGSGWNAALIAQIVYPGRVLSLEIDSFLIEKARERIKMLNISNLEVRKENFFGLNEKFDRIIFTAGILKEQKEKISEFSSTRLFEKGISLCPYQHGSLVIFKKENGKVLERETGDEYDFVPLII